MEKLTIKHLAPYLPYDLKAKIGKERAISAPMSVTFEMISGSEVDNVPCFRSNSRDKYKIFPILRPLSDLTKEIEHDGKKFIPLKEMKKQFSFDDFFLEFDGITVESLPSKQGWITWNLIKYHFDVFGLIEKGLAIDINTLNQTK